MIDYPALADRLHARRSLYRFTRHMFRARKGHDWQRAEHHRIICGALERVYRGECRRLIVNIPPRYSKTELALNWLAWTLGKNPDAEFILTSYSATLASNNAALARDIVTHEEYRQIFPRVALRDDATAKHDWRTTAGGIIYAAGAGGTITGFGAGKAREGFGGAIIVDDPHKPDEATSRAQRRNVQEWFQNTLESRKNSQQTPIIIIMQRLHPDDLSGWLLAGGNCEKWEHVCLPALQDDGTPLWAEKHTADDLARMKAANRIVFAGQYMQQPVAEGGNIIKGEWFQSYDVAPRMKWRAVYVDTAQKTGERNDFTVAEEWGLGDDGKLYLLDMLRGRFEVPDLERRLPAFWAKCAARETSRWGALRAMKIEDAASGTGLIQKLKREHRLPVQGITRRKDKYSRLLDVLGYIEAGHVCIPRAASFTSDFLAECEAFTADDSHAHDDQVDPMVDAIGDMLGSNALANWSKWI
jgi:predicted phage terminase large subunit-like protein